MIIKFKYLIIHNFLSYGHAELDLTDKHYCLVKGENKGLVDNASSNGAGKSSWSSAICWALTGETIQGLSSNIKNINVDENLCYVEVLFEVDNNLFRVRRYKNPKSDLKIELNNNDISGKGIRESEAVLNRYLPDLTSQLIASIIILGQGLPNKFTNNTPSGRKEVLEKLSKSDFMIEDLKNRINNRHLILKDHLRTLEDSLLKNSTQIEILNSQVTDLQNKLENLRKTDYASDLSQIRSNITLNQHKLAEISQTLSNIKLEYDANVKVLSDLRLAQSTEKAAEDSDFNAFALEYTKIRTSLTTNIAHAEQELQKMLSVTDVCPTCGQKLPNVSKEDVANQIKAMQEELSNLKADLANKEEIYRANLSQHLQIIEQITLTYDNQIKALSDLVAKQSTQINSLSADEKQLQQQLHTLELNQITVLKNQEELAKQLTDLEAEIIAYTKRIFDLNANIKCDQDSIIDTKARINIIQQMLTLTKRDFRGYLLSEIIQYISNKAKEYCLEVFKTDFIDFELDGNNINISYYGKAFENLSGGEKQRIDLILQFAIRDMMRKYLNFSSNILVLDEIFDQLDVIGCESILSLIASKLLDVESIFIISHRADELEIPCDYELTVVKDEQGVSRFK